MANRDEIERVVAGCTDCGSVYAAQQWPDGTLRIIGRNGCQCGSTVLSLVDQPDDGRPIDEPATD